MALRRYKIAWSRRRIKAALAIAIVCYGAFMLINTARQKEHERYPWVSPRKDLEKPWRGHPRHSDFKNETSEGEKKPVGLKKPTQTSQDSGNKTMSPPKPELGNSEKIETHCTKTLKSLAKYSKWFHDRFKPNVKLFMDKGDINNYSDLLTRGLPYGFKGQNLTVFNQILKNENFTNPPIYGAEGKQGCIRCAVVGSGGILNGSRAGQEIDGHDYVFRLNRAISRGRFAKDVGKRTTFYTFFPESQRLTEVEDKNMIAFFTMFKAYDVAYAKKMIEGDKSKRYITKLGSGGMKRPGLDPSKAKLVHPGFVDYVSEVFLEKKARPTTGSVVVILSLHICDEVTIYGFGYDPRFSMYYYDSKFITHTHKSTATHNVDNERELWMKLHEEGVIRLFKRDLQ